jgi:hypothetical protein
VQEFTETDGFAKWKGVKMMPAMQQITEPPRQTDVRYDCDVCVLGGSCTGVFAAVRAARLGAKVVLVERMGSFGGVATISLVNVWHSPKDTIHQRPIIGGLTVEVMERLKKRDAVIDRPNDPSWVWAFNPYELMIELDRLVLEHEITPLLHTAFVAPHVVDGKLDAVFVENKSGRCAIKAKYFIDATGDGDLAHRAGLPTYKASHLLPSTTCAMISGWKPEVRQPLTDLVAKYGPDLGMPKGFIWGAPVIGTDMYMLAGTRVKFDPSLGDEFSRSEIEGRRQVAIIMEIAKKHLPQHKLALAGLPARIGLRESRHVTCGHKLTGEEVLHGVRFDDAIANGSYRVDIHHVDKPGITFRYLDGTETYLVPGEPNVQGRWRDPIAKDPTFYQIPYRSMLPGQFPNLLIAGRMIDADPQAHAAIRVMVNMNQTGEAAGVASVLAMRSTQDVRTIDVSKLRHELAAGGSVII